MNFFINWNSHVLQPINKFSIHEYKFTNNILIEFFDLEYLLQQIIGLNFWPFPFNEQY